MKKVGIILYILILMSVAGVSYAAFPAGFSAESIVSGLNLPTTFTFAGPDKIFVAEKEGAIKLIINGVLQAQEVIQLPDVNTEDDRGVIGLVADPNFELNGFLYVFYTHENDSANPTGPKTGVLRKLIVQNNVAQFASSTILLGSVQGDAINPSCENFPITADCVPSDSEDHSVGGLRFGPDGYLWISTGDGSSYHGVDPLALRSQNIDVLSGKILRINAENGQAPADNPYYNGDPSANRSKVWSYGMRNAYRFNFRPSTGQLYAGDVGWYTTEEIDKIVRGGNYGWPCREGLGLTGYNCTPVSMWEDPFYTYSPTLLGASVVAGAFATTTDYPAEYVGKYFFADFVNGWMKVMDINNTDTAIISINDFADSTLGPVDIQTGPDGYIYYISIYNGALNKIIYDSNIPTVPIPHLESVSTTPSTAYVGQNISISSAISNSGGSDPFIIDVEIYDSNGVKIGSRAWDPVSLASGETQIFAFDWIPSEVGQYRVSVGLFYAGWAGLYEWNNFVYTFDALNYIPPVENLVPNSGVEIASSTQPTNPLQWNTGGYGVNQRAFFYPVLGLTGNGLGVEITSFTSGDAKWFFNHVPVASGSQYIFSDSFKSNSTTTVTAQFKRADGTVYYKWIGDAFPSDDWTKFTGNVVIPSDVVSVTMFHLLRNVGYLYTDSFSLSELSSPLAGDIIKPLVSITAPLSGSIISGITTFNASTTDANGILRAQFLIDGKYVGAEDNTFPYELLFDTRNVSNGAHWIQAQVWDNAGNNRVSSLPVPVMVNNPQIDPLNYGSGSLLFDGENDYVDFANWNIEETNGFTLEAVVRPQIGVSTFLPLLIKGENSTSSDWHLGLSKNVDGVSFAIEFKVRATNQKQAVLRAGNILDGELAHISAIFNSYKLIIYKNGVFVGSQILEGDVATSTARVYMGGAPGGQAYQGDIDSFRVWNLPKTIDEVRANINTENIGIGNGLIKHWKLNEGFGQDVIDSSNSGHHGILGFSSSTDISDPDWVGGLGGGSSGTFVPQYISTIVTGNQPPIFPGYTTTITSTVKNIGDGPGYAIYYYDIFNSTGARVFNRYFDGEIILPGEQRDFIISWTPPAPGIYRVAFAIMKLNWSGLYQWVDEAALISAQPSIYPIYNDVLNISWTNWSWDTALDFATTTTQSGPSAIAVNFMTPLAGLYLHYPGFNTDGRATLSMFIRSQATSSPQLQIRAFDAGGNPLSPVSFETYLPGGPSSTEWKKIEIPLQDLGIATSTFNGINIQGRTGEIEPGFLLDNVILE